MTKQAVYYCPGCGKEAEVIQVDNQHGDIGDMDVTWKRIHLECRQGCPLLWACYDEPDECFAGALQNRRAVLEVDNRDERTTWLWISRTDYIEVDPIDLLENMLDNCVGKQGDEDSPRHPEDRLCGVVEAALNRAMNSTEWLGEMAKDTEFGISQNTADDVYLALESYITEHLARITK